jgi:hypothetical protein
LAKNRILEAWRSKYAVLVSSKNFILSWHKVIPENKPNTLINTYQQLKEDHKERTFPLYEIHWKQK